MPLDLDPIYHTETMVVILRDQGSTLMAMELCEKILEKTPENSRIRRILEELKGEARASFDRFRPSGNQPQKKEIPPQETSSARLQKLQTLLHRVQGYRRDHEVLK